MPSKGKKAAKPKTPRPCDCDYAKIFGPATCELIILSRDRNFKPVRPPKRIVLGEGELTADGRHYILNSFGNGEGPIRVSYLPEDYERGKRVRLALEVLDADEA
jgi:hypothetical protein